MSKNSYDIISLDSPLLNANVKENIDTDTPFIFSRLKFFVSANRGQFWLYYSSPGPWYVRTSAVVNVQRIFVDIAIKTGKKY